MSKRELWAGLSLAGILVALGAAYVVVERKAVVQAAGVQAPKFEVDPLWPKPLPNHWLMGNTIGVSVDAQDHIWIIHRQGSLEAMENYAVANPPGPKRQAGVVESECCGPAPAVLEFDEAGNLLASWGGKDGENYVWPLSNHGITVDFKGNVWIGGNGAQAGVAAEETLAPVGTKKAAPKAAPTPGGPPLYHDSMVLKFTQDYFPHVTGRYALSFSEIPGTLVVDSEPYQEWLLPGQRKFLLLQPAPNTAP